MSEPMTPADRLAAPEVEAAARALWKMGNARIGERPWGSVAAHYIAEATVALDAAHAVRVASPTAPEEIIEIDEAGVVHPKGRMVKDATGRYVKSTVLRDPEPEGPCVAPTAPDIRNPFDDEGWWNAMVQQFHDEWHHTKPDKRRDIVQAFMNYLRKRIRGAAPADPAPRLAALLKELCDRHGDDLSPAFTAGWLASRGVGVRAAAEEPT